MRKWRCSCGQWIPCGYSRHAHNEHVPREMSLEEMKAERWKGSSDPLAAERTVKVTWEHKTPEHEMKDFPDEF